MGFVFHCFNCFHRETARGFILSGHSRRCVECGSTLSVAGPLWLGKISDRDFDGLIEVELEKRKLKSAQRIANMLTLIKNESDSNVGYYVIDEMCDMLGLPVPSVEKVVEALEKQGFGSDLTHFNPRGIRAKAPAHVLANILKGLAGSIRGHR
jgi:tRNA (guanine26-N2/guanine27-N2)-dimethyltransferase